MRSRGGGETREKISRPYVIMFLFYFMFKPISPKRFYPESTLKYKPEFRMRFVHLPKRDGRTRRFSGLRKRLVPLYWRLGYKMDPLLYKK